MTREQLNQFPGAPDPAIESEYDANLALIESVPRLGRSSDGALSYFDYVGRATLGDRAVGIGDGCYRAMAVALEE